MISLPPDHLRTLTLIVAHPGEYDAERIGQALYRPKITGTHDYLAVRRAIIDGSGHWQAKASAILHALQKAGLIDKLHPPTVAAEWADEAGESPMAVVRAASANAGDIIQSRLTAILLERLVLLAPATVAEWVGAAPSGNVQRAVRSLVEWGVVVPRTCRWPTEAGIALVDGMGRHA